MFVGCGSRYNVCMERTSMMVEAKDRLKNKYQYSISVFIMCVIYDGYM